MNKEWRKVVNPDAIKWLDENGNVRKTIYTYSMVELYYDEDGKRHREDGPAICPPAKPVTPHTGFSNSPEWYWHNKKINCTTQEEFERIVKLKAFW